MHSVLRERNMWRILWHNVSITWTPKKQSKPTYTDFNTVEDINTDWYMGYRYIQKHSQFAGRLQMDAQQTGLLLSVPFLLLFL